MKKKKAAHLEKSTHNIWHKLLHVYIQNVEERKRKRIESKATTRRV